MVESVDLNMGRLLTRLQELNLEENTVVIFASDNGAVESTSDNTPFRKGKGYLYEGGIRVPFMMRWPGHIPGGSVTDNETISQDIFPTIIDIAGLNLPKENSVDGRSLVPDFKLLDHHPDLFWYYPHYSPQAKMPGAAVRSGEYKLIQFYDPETVELYHLVNDIGEENDLSAALPEKVEELSGKLEHWLDEKETILHTLNPEYLAPEN